MRNSNRRHLGKAAYPDTLVPYSTEIGFGRLDGDADAIGESLLTRIVDARRGHFTHQVLEAKNFLLGEEIRSGGSWAQPERWGTWLCHSQGDVVFALAEDASQLYYVFLRLRVCGWLHDRPIRILANGEALWNGINRTTSERCDDSGAEETGHGRSLAPADRGQG